MHTSWKIRKRAQACFHTGVAFEDGDSFYTALFDDDSEGEDALLRKDFSEDAWRELSESITPFSFWKTRFELPVDVKNEPVVKEETAEDLLRRLLEENDEHTENARFILAAMLERDKVLKEVDAKETEGAKFRIYEHRESGDVLIVRDPGLLLDEVEGIQDEVVALLEGGSSTGEEATLDEPPGADTGDHQAQGNGDAPVVEVAAQPPA